MANQLTNFNPEKVHCWLQQNKSKTRKNHRKSKKVSESRSSCPHTHSLAQWKPQLELDFGNSSFCILHFIFVFGFASHLERRASSSPSWVGNCRIVELSAGWAARLHSSCCNRLVMLATLVFALRLLVSCAVLANLHKYQRPLDFACLAIVLGAGAYYIDAQLREWFFSEITRLC